MGAFAAAEIDTWLREGGLVITASDRAARALAAEFHHARQAEGLTAWPAPRIFNWKSFVHGAWQQRTGLAEARLLLNPVQEQAIWAAIAGEDQSPATVLTGPRQRLAALAMEAHELLCTHAPRFLRTAARSGWQQDAAAFSGWLEAFDQACREQNLLSPSRLPLELTALLEAGSAARPPLLLAGFDRILPAQRALFDAWGAWREAPQGAPAAEVHFYAAGDAQAEAAACAIWCRRCLAARPQARLLVIAQAARARRGAMERAFLEHAGPAFEFSLGIPLSQVALGRAALLLLRWLTAPLAEQELDWLFSSGYAAADAQESAALLARMRALRRTGRERPQWTLEAFTGQRCAAGALPEAWVERMLQAQQLLTGLPRRAQSPFDWAELVPQLLSGLCFATARPLESAEYQAVQRWQQAVESCGSLGFDGRRIAWRDFLFQLRRTLDETLFTPESRHAPIQIAGPAESAGLHADAVWFLGADEDSWPASGPAHPLLPIEVQREAGMPHATPQLDGELTKAITSRLLASAPAVHFSYARQTESAEARPSRLIVQMAGEAQEIPAELAAPPCPAPLTEIFADASRIPFPPGKAAGGSGVLTDQSQCPFRAFATVRLGAQDWQPAEEGLTAAQRGQLLHGVLRSVWSKPPGGIRSHAGLLELHDRRAFVAGHTHRVFQEELPFDWRARMPRRYLELEEQRVVRLVSEWLDYEAARIDFTVAETELQHTASIAGLTLSLRLDRIDRLNDGSQLVIDYKSGYIPPHAWDLPRPADVQLPLYAGFALNPGETLGGLTFAKVRAGEMNFSGYVGDAAATLFTGLKGASSLVKNPLTLEQLLAWRDCLQRLAEDFLNGRAEVDPCEYPGTCKYCHLQSLCRIQEHRMHLEDEDDSGGEEAAFE